MELISLTHKEGMKLLKEGNSLTKKGINMDTLFIKNGEIHWMGINDKGPTILEEDDTKSLFRGKIWAINIR